LKIAMLAVWLLVTATSFPVDQELLDRTLALVGGQPITLSDTRAAVALGLIERGAGPDDDVVSQLIRRELILREVQRYAPAAPSPSAVDARLAEVRKRFPDAASLARVLEAHAFTEARLRAWLADNLRTEVYLAQRFASASTPSDTEISRHYTANKAQFDARKLSFEDAAPLIRNELIERRRGELILDWVSDLRRRTEVVILQP
jgi:hypothetical protein